MDNSIILRQSQRMRPMNFLSLRDMTDRRLFQKIPFPGKSALVREECIKNFGNRVHSSRIGYIIYNRKHESICWDFFVCSLPKKCRKMDSLFIFGQQPPGCNVEAVKDNIVKRERALLLTLVSSRPSIQQQTFVPSVARETSLLRTPQSQQ